MIKQLEFPGRNRHSSRESAKWNPISEGVILSVHVNCQRTMGLLSVSAMLALVAVAFLSTLPTGTTARYHIGDRVIHLKHGRLHPVDDESEVDEEGHLRYKWLEDDILRAEDEYDGEEEEEEEEPAENMVKMPGGCELTEEQYDELESFKKETRYVKKCYCEQGGVYCQLMKNFLREKST